MKKIDITPKWSDVLPLMLEMVRNGEYDAAKNAIGEFERMADAADKWNDSCKTEPSNTIADAVAALFKNDGQCFELEGGLSIGTVMVDRFNARVNRKGSSFSDPVAYRFNDGSAIVIHGDAWDVEGETPFSWKGE